MTGACSGERPRRRGLWLLAMVTCLAGSRPARADAPANVGDASGEATEQGLPSDELDRMLAPLGHDSVDERRSAALAIASLGQEGIGAVARKLAELRRGGDDGAATVLKGLRERAARDSDLLETLVLLKPETGVRHALTMVCLLRALAHAGSTPAVRQLILVANDAAGALRPEVVRLVKQLADRAVAALIESRRSPSPETRAWATSLLESLGKRTPGDAVQTKDNQVLADVLRAYGSIKDLDALPVCLSFVGSDRVQVRNAARDATVAYGQDAVWRLREAYAVLMGEQAPEGMPAGDLAKKLFEAHDRYRQRDVYALLEQGLAAQKDGRPKDAAAAFDDALARAPMLDRRAEMVHAYVEYGESVELTDRPTALALLRKALRLNDTGPESTHIRSEVDYLEGVDLAARGIDDPEPFEQALALDPKNARARAALDRLQVEAESSRSRGWRLAAAGAVLALALAGIVVFGGRRR